MKNIRRPEPEFVNVEGAPDSIPRNRFRSPGYMAGRIDSLVSIPGLLKRLQIRAQLDSYATAKSDTVVTPTEKQTDENVGGNFL
jgi:hypothetical protein